MTKYIKIAPDPDAKPCRCGEGNPDCDHFDFCPECGEEYKEHEGHDCLDGFAVAQVGTAKELRDAAKELRDSLDACETERDSLRSSQAPVVGGVPPMTDADLDAIYSAPNGSMWHVAAHRAYKLAASRLPAPKPGEVVVNAEEYAALLDFADRIVPIRGNLSGISWVGNLKDVFAAYDNWYAIRIAQATTTEKETDHVES